MKKVLSFILILSLLTLTFASCAAKFNEEDQQLAEACATQAAAEYYRDYFKGKTISGVSYSDGKTSVKNSTFEKGSYIVTIELVANVSSGGYYLSRPVMDIKYSITVKDGTATIVKTQYLTQN